MSQIWSKCLKSEVYLQLWYNKGTHHYIFELSSWHEHQCRSCFHEKSLKIIWIVHVNKNRSTRCSYKVQMYIFTTIWVITCIVYLWLHEKTISGYGSPNSHICIIWYNLYGFNSKVVDAKRVRVISFMICSLKITDDKTCRLYYICSIVVGAVCLKTLSIKIIDDKNPELILYNWNKRLKEKTVRWTFYIVKRWQ